MDSKLKQILLETMPCDDCELAQSCQDNGTACAAFASYMDGESEEQWRALPREPLYTIAASLGIQAKTSPDGSPNS